MRTWKTIQERHQAVSKDTPWAHASQRPRSSGLNSNETSPACCRRRNELPNKRRRLDVCQCIREPLGVDVTCDVSSAGPDFNSSVGPAHVAPEGCLPPALAPHLGDDPATPHSDQPIEPTEVSIDNQMSRLHSALQVNIVILSLFLSIMFSGMFRRRCICDLGEDGPATLLTD
jgi:hypothetical protein